MKNTKADALNAIQVLKDACRTMNVSQQTAITYRATLNNMECCITSYLADDVIELPLPCGTYTPADHVMTANDPTPTEWVNVFAVNGMVRDGLTIHQTKALADLYWQIDADQLELDIESESFRWIGAVEFKAE